MEKIYISKSDQKYIKEAFESMREKEQEACEIINEISSKIEDFYSMINLVGELNVINVELGDKYYDFFERCIKVYWNGGYNVKNGENDGHNRGSRIIFKEYK